MTEPQKAPVKKAAPKKVDAPEPQIDIAKLASGFKTAFQKVQAELDEGTTHGFNTLKTVYPDLKLSDFNLTKLTEMANEPNFNIIEFLTKHDVDVDLGAHGFVNCRIIVDTVIPKAALEAVNNMPDNTKNYAATAMVTGVIYDYLDYQLTEELENVGWEADSTMVWEEA